RARPAPLRTPDPIATPGRARAFRSLGREPNAPNRRTPRRAFAAALRRALRQRRPCSTALWPPTGAELGMLASGAAATGSGRPPKVFRPGSERGLREQAGWATAPVLFTPRKLGRSWRGRDRLPAACRGSDR